MLLLGIDLGTTGVKAVAFTETGEIRAMQYEPYNQEASHGKRELQAQFLWNATSHVLAEVCARCPGETKGAVCVSSFGEGFVCLDEQGKEISPVMLLTDDRGSGETEAFVEMVGAEKITAICGLKPHNSYSLSKILYLKNYCPEIYEKTRHILLMGDYIYYKLAGIHVTDYSLASRTMLFDVYHKCWSRELLRAADVPEELFSRPIQGGSIVGQVEAGIAAQLGLPALTTLVMGGHDQPVAAVVSRGKKKYSLCSMGTSECITPVLDDILDTERILCNGHPNEPFMEDGKYNTLAYNVTSGLLSEWSTKVFTRRERTDGQDVYKILEQEMPVDPTRILVLPYLHGSGTPWLDSRTRLCLLGIDESDRRGDIYRGILEGLCMDQRLNLDRLGDAIPQSEEILVTGGGSHSAGWVQMKADILKRPVYHLECRQSGALGCAILCAVAMGIYTSIEEAVETMVRITTRVEPREETVAFYDEKYEMYQQLYDTCRAANIYAGKM